MKYLTLEEAGVFHGHIGPFLTIGYRAGEYAREVLKPVNEHDLIAEVELPMEIPYTCILDGIQCSSKCTLGKMNITAIKSPEKRIKISFKSRSSGVKLTMEVYNEVINEVSKIKDLNEASRFIINLPLERLFKVSIERS